MTINLEIVCPIEELAVIPWYMHPTPETTAMWDDMRDRLQLAGFRTKIDIDIDRRSFF